MDHRLVEEQNVAAAYVAGQLGPEEEEAFEEHLLECRECRERVVLAEDLRSSFHAMAAEDAARAVQIGLLAWLARHGRTVGLGLAAALLLTLSGGLLVEQGKLRRELAATRAAPRPAAAPAPPAPAVMAERDRLAGEARRLQQELSAAKRREDELSGRIAALTRPQVNTALFTLGLARGKEEPNRVVVGREPAWIVLSIELPAPPGETYQATLVDARGRTLWRGEGLHPTASDTLVLTLYSDLLAPGGYRLLLGAPRQPGTAEIPFEVVRR
jgi:hypothetical protein